MAAADDPDIAGAQPVAQLRQDAELVVASVDDAARQHVRHPALPDEACWSIFRQGGPFGPIYLAQHLDGAKKRGRRRHTLEFERIQERGRPAPDVAVVPGQARIGVERLWPCQCFGFSDGGAELLPGNHRFDGGESIPLLVVSSDQGITDAGKETDLVVDGSGIGLEGADLPSFGLAKEGADQAVEHIDGLVGLVGGEVQANGDQRRVPALPLMVGDMLDRAAASLTNKLSKARLMDLVAATGLDADRAHMLEAFDQTKHGIRLGGFRHLPQPGQPVLAGLFLPLCQRIELAPLFGGQIPGQAAIHFPMGLVAECATQPFKCIFGRNDNPALAACLHHQSGQMDEAVVLDRLRQEDFGQFCRRSPAERTQSELALAFDGMVLAIPLGCEVCVNRLREDPELPGDKCKQRSRRPFAGAQGTTGIAQVAEHKGVAEAIVIAVGATDCGKIRFRQREVAHQFPLLGRRVK